MIAFIQGDSAGGSKLIEQTLIRRQLYFICELTVKPGFHKANFNHDNDQFRTKTKRLMGRVTAQPYNRFVYCVVVVEFAVNGNQALSENI